METSLSWKCRDYRLELGRSSQLVGILNATPDSFSDGGSYMESGAAVGRALKLFDDGASVVDIGGESTRPGFTAVDAREEIARVEPIVRAILKTRPTALLSIDTSKASVARVALRAGASILNDVWGFQRDEELPRVAAEAGAGVVLMRNGRAEESPGPVLDRIRRSWERSVEIAVGVGLSADRIVLDPGIGFGTSRSEDLQILGGLEVLRAFGFPMMLGTSRKRITGQPRGLPAQQREEATLASTVIGIAAGVELFRVHDVQANARAAWFADMIYRGGELDE